MFTDLLSNFILAPTQRTDDTALGIYFQSDSFSLPFVFLTLSVPFYESSSSSSAPLSQQLHVSIKGKETNLKKKKIEIEDCNFIMWLSQPHVKDMMAPATGKVPAQGVSGEFSSDGFSESIY